MNAAVHRSVIGAVMTVTLVATGLVSATSSPASASGWCDRPTTKPVSTLVGDRHPLVFVHGWTDNGDGLNDTWKAIDDRLPNTFQAIFFDYRNANTEWAASPKIAGCLATLLDEVARAHRTKGGDGRVYVVAHSMGGLATRFAANHGGAEALAGLTTIGTPHLGSPFGNTRGAELWQRVKEFEQSKLFADKDSDAARCLAIHNRDRDLPAGCEVPPYLPAGAAIGQISGTNVVRRTLFGVALYDIDLRSDGIVGVDSATGYSPESGPRDTSAPRPAAAYLENVSCTVTSDQTLELMRSFQGGALPVSIMMAELKAIALLNMDSQVLDQISNGTLGPELAVMLIVATLMFPCGHNAIATQPDSMDGVVDSLRAQLHISTDTCVTDGYRFENAHGATPCDFMISTWRAYRTGTIPVDPTTSLPTAFCSNTPYAAGSVGQCGWGGWGFNIYPR